MPKQPHDAAAELRELITEAHGILKDQRALLREIREARAEFETTTQRAIQPTIDKIQADILHEGAELSAKFAAINVKVDAQSEQLFTHVAQLLGTRTTGEMLEALGLIVARSITPDLRAGLVKLSKLEEGYRRA